MTISKILIANRGEIAVRIIRTAQRMGYRTVAVYSDADRDLPHVVQADEAIRIGPPPIGESYLNSKAILQAAKRSRAQAIHPGYGFLSENADFAQACVDAGLIFIGPSAKAIRLMGNKRQARARVLAAGIDCVPGYEGPLQDYSALLREAERIGFPVMIKAAAGGGGRGMRKVEQSQDFADALTQAQAEAKSAFGSDEVLLEKALDDVRHVEVQVFGDTHGHIVHLGERDCSVQRRHQKVIEEAPSPAVNEKLRQRMGNAAVTVAKAIDYVGAGTVEFLLDSEHRFYFMEMNTRLQVEHPVTEWITGLDLVEWQLRVADGESLPLTQQQIVLSGHAIEARLYAEDANADYRPQTGCIASWVPAVGEGVRVDAGIRTGQEITSYYDPMLAKIIAGGCNRREALRRLIRALEDTHILGVTTNRNFLIEILRNEVFRNGEATTAFLTTRTINFLPPPETSQTALALAAVLFSGERPRGWRSTGSGSWPLRLQSDEEMHMLVVTQQANRLEVHFPSGNSVLIELYPDDNTSPSRSVRYLCNDHMGLAYYARMEADLLVMDLQGYSFVYRSLSFSDRQDATTADALLFAPMSGKVVEARVGPGDAVAKGQILVILESMKMFHQLVASRDSRVLQVFVRVNEQVDIGARLVELEPAT